MAEDRSWMYNRIEKGLVRSEFRDGVLRFVDFALHQPGCTDGAKIKCPCILPKCRNKRYLEVDEVMIHLCRKGFIPHYEVWSSHGERFVHKDTHVGESSNRVDYRGDYIQMVMDAAGPEMFDVEMDEEPNPDAKKFYELLDAASKPLYPGSEKHTQLSFISRILNVKCESKMSNSAFSDVLQLIKEVIPEPNPGVPGNYYQAKKLMRGMAKIAGPVQYRWMYPFERYLRNLKSNVKNKNKVEGSIANAFLMEELYMARGRGDYSQRLSSGRGSGSGGRGSVGGTGTVGSGHGGTQHESGGRHGNCSPEYQRRCPTPDSRPHLSLESRPLDTPDSGRGSVGADNFGSVEHTLANVPVNRERAWIAADGKRLMPAGTAKRTTECFLAKIHDNAFGWKLLTEDQKRDYFAYFKRYFAWDEADDAAYYTAWKQHAARMYAVLMNRFHDTYKKKAMKHPALSDAQYQQWCVHWSDPDFQKISSIKRDNRHSEVCGQGTGMSRHLGGSIPVLKHMDNMRKKASGESPNAWEVFQKIKCRNGVPVDEQSKQIKDRMDARIKQLTDEGVAYDINEVFGEVNAKTKKQRVVGLGSAASSFCIAPSGPSGESSGQSTRQVTEEIQQLKENLNIKDEEIRQLKEEQESMKEQFNEKLAEVFRRLDGTNEC
ncbi:hypothetical protein POM88_046122 [Heracleum sosnowskyi]|uniref:Transposase-associated domain-containing protein n=1 Tax=Heracleum sosnowskyi TaxID=360622 RepID=A0AAD8H8N2_9APIA|nr:hypothetical protein POM88_046122 [Heracleum sosnowskyi]